MNIFQSQFYNGVFIVPFTQKKRTAKIFVYLLICMSVVLRLWSFYAWEFIDKILKPLTITDDLRQRHENGGKFVETFIKIQNGC